MPDSFVLRFRDLTNDDPIKQHRRLISDTGYVWWGWWKKDSEPGRASELGELRERSRTEGMTVGLFDRSQRSFFLANVVECVFAEGAIASPEPHRTPSYYATEKVSAWLKLTSIEELLEDEFSRTFVDIPTGDGTFFPVWKERSRGSGVQAKLDVIPLPSSSVLHLSDVHLGADYGFPQRAGPGTTPLLDLIARDFDVEKPGLIVVSGDFTTRADANVLQDDGLRFLRSLATKLDVDRERFVLVPGNHDIALKKWRPHDYSHENSFHLFVKEFFGEPRPYPDLRQFSAPDGQRIEVLSINSVRLRHETEKQFGYVQWPLYDDFLRKYPHDPDVIRLAVLHHDLVPAPREETLSTEYPEASVSTTLDAGAVIEGLQHHGFTLALHGHQHVPAITRVARATRPKGAAKALEELGATLVVMAAGSAGAMASRLSNEMRDNSYNIVRLTRDNAEVEARRFTPGSNPETLYRFRAR